MNTPNGTQIVLLLIGLEQRFSGKTNLQKNIYLIKEMLKDCELPFKFKPYFYGPYSEQVSDSLDLLENSDILKSTQINFGIDDMFEIRQTSYELTPLGMNAFDRINQSFPDFVSIFKEKYNLIKETGFHQNTKILSTAAKIKLILSLENKPLNIENIKDRAKELGWEIEDSDIDSAKNVLFKTNLAKPAKM